MVIKVSSEKNLKGIVKGEIINVRLGASLYAYYIVKGNVSQSVGQNLKMGCDTFERGSQASRP